MDFEERNKAIDDHYRGLAEAKTKAIKEQWQSLAKALQDGVNNHPPSISWKCGIEDNGKRFFLAQEDRFSEVPADRIISLYCQFDERRAEVRVWSITNHFPEVFYGISADDSGRAFLRRDGKEMSIKNAVDAILGPFLEQ